MEDRDYREIKKLLREGYEKKNIIKYVFFGIIFSLWNYLEIYSMEF